MSWSFLLFFAGSVSLAVTLNVLSRQGGLAGVRLALATLCGGATIVIFAMMGASTAETASAALPWVCVVRAGVGVIGGALVGLGFVLATGGAKWVDRLTLLMVSALLLVGAVTMRVHGQDSIVRTAVSWIPSAPALRLVDSGVIGLGTVCVIAGAVTRWRHSRHGRGAMLAVVTIQSTAAIIYFVVRLTGDPELQQRTSALTIAFVAATYWLALERWRVAGLSDAGFALAFDRIPKPVIVVDLQTSLCVLNPCARTLFGPSLTARQLMQELNLAGDDVETALRTHAAEPLMAVALPGVPGTLHDVTCYYDPRLALGVVVLTDVTERVSHAERMKAALDALHSAQDRLIQQEKLAALGVLVAGVNHEINNPLSWVAANLRTLGDYNRALLRGVFLAERAVKGEPESTEELRRWLEDPDVREAADDSVQALRDANEGCSQIQEIIASMRLLSRKQEEIHMADLSELAKAGVKVARTNLSPSVRLEAQLAPSLRVRAVAGEITRVVTNLVVNAGQALGERGNVWVRTFVDGNEAVLEVRDDGPGVPAGLRQRIFDPFFTTKPPGQGTGLGLAISAETARRHSGHLGLVETEAPGATFQLRLPRCDEEDVDTNPHVKVFMPDAAPMVAAVRAR